MLVGYRWGVIMICSRGKAMTVIVVGERKDEFDKFVKFLQTDQL